MYGKPRQKGPNTAIALLLSPRSSTVACFEGITILNEGPVSLVLDRWRKDTRQKSTVIEVLEVGMAEKWRFNFLNGACYPLGSKSALKDDKFDTR